MLSDFCAYVQAFIRLDQRVIKIPASRIGVFSESVIMDRRRTPIYHDSSDVAGRQVDSSLQLFHDDLHWKYVSQSHSQDDSSQTQTVLR